MERTVQSTTTKEVSTATVDGWNLTFTSESGTNANVNVQGQKGPYNMNAYANATTNNVGFSNGAPYDTDLASAVAEEMELILNPVE
ncbi:hypothetical protein [Parapedobacter indicus]|uniref:Uncharacterized protein n=1 Tax=Parapedobacter indicus TaxID=1477437 RepID=A0A1I3VU41_9SPHI|nr:hypothetical protein [Parapedobacter indicus]SFJ98680.1 hypothetical protein SAMN05444682_1276 [Parapedobacter indicus]